MIYHGTSQIDRIYVKEEGNEPVIHWFDLMLDDEKPVFTLTSCCNEEWIWKFYYTKTNYDIVKYLVMESSVNCEDIYEITEELDEIFCEEYEDIVYWEDEEEFVCNGDCENCPEYYDEDEDEEN